MGLVELAVEGSGKKGARINMEALLRHDLDPQPPPQQSSGMAKKKARDRETVRSRQNRVQVPKPSRKTPLLKKNEELLATSSTNPAPKGPVVAPPAKRSTKYQPPKNSVPKTQSSKTLSNSSSLKTLTSTTSAVSNVSNSQNTHPGIPKFKNTKTVVKGKRPPEVKTSSSTNEQKYVTISESQLTQILNLVSQGIQVQQNSLQNLPQQAFPQPAPQQPQPSAVPVAQPTEKLAAQTTVAPDPSVPLEPEKEPAIVTRDELLETTQKAVPLAMKSSFLPYEAIPRGDVVDKERREQQLAWRRELEKQRDEDVIRKKKEKEEYEKHKKIDHHLDQKAQSEYKSSIKIIHASVPDSVATGSAENGTGISPRMGGTQPLSMQSSFHPSANVSNVESLDQQRKDQQLAWRRELEKQRDEDLARKKEAKERDQKLKLIDHHLHQPDQNYQKPSIKLIQDNPNHQDHISSLGSFQSAVDQLHGTHVGDTGHHRNMNALKDPAELERLEKLRKQHAETERDLQLQIEEKKRARQSARGNDDDGEPWWVKQDRKIANANRRNQAQPAPQMPDRPIHTHQAHPPKQAELTVDVLHSKFDTDTTTTQLKGEPMVAPLKLEDLLENSRRSPSPQRNPQTAKKSAEAKQKTLLEQGSKSPSF
ncbi:Oidioi.mRNA.OKI2018_I69.chr2.g4317.t1.cds [Oikopleura dioica]|uniref:Oidioi.mRNA.OKI2018_I69.chr2.g4317.t1.cds n=1 Tax=Oikopleura dioica TaxID=34765 RepID=A0ABN7SWY5_OIKDI|nr:Oidioi.mRNA.OKI2018_I69.chr2.g4317.t1.cds [Oikopleura dioica]